jgi:uncharacterized protein
MLRFNVAELLRSAPGTRERHEVSGERLSLADGLELARPLSGELRLSSDGRGVLVQGHLETALAEPCSRCLRPAEARIGVDLDEEALPSIDLDSGLPVDTSAEPDALRLDDHHELDLEPAVRDAILLAEPIAPLCRPDCPGLCVTCGADLASDPQHGHPDEDIDPRLAAMASLRDRLPADRGPA